jgi:hypothetical protein
MARRKKDQVSAPEQTIQEMDDDQLFQLFDGHKDKYKLALAAKKKADAGLKNTAKIAKADLGKAFGKTINVVELIKRAIELETEEGRESIDEEISAIMRIARWAGAPIGTQFELEMPAEADRFYEEGRRAGLRGATAKPPSQLAPGSDQYNDWMRGHGDGQAAIVKGFKAPQKAEDGEPPQGISREEWKRRTREETAAEDAHIKKTAADIAAKRGGDAVDSLTAPAAAH